MKKVWKKLRTFFVPTEPSSQHYGSWRYCLLKIGVCSVIILLLATRKSLFHLPESANKWIGILSLPVAIFCLYQIYITVAELGEGNHERSDSNENRKPVLIRLEEIIRLAAENDIIEFVICFDHACIKCGASSDSTPTEMFDKRYYIGQTEFSEIEEFASRLSEYSVGGAVEVVTIDGLGVQNWNIESGTKKTME